MTQLERIEELEKEIKKLKGLNDNGIPSCSFSKISKAKLWEFVDIEIALDDNIFNTWFNNSLFLSKKTINFLIKLLKEEKNYIRLYDEEDLKMKFLSQIFNHINFKTDGFRDFYNEPLRYETDKFILNGEVDFVLAKGIKYSEKPYFFIQEFKQQQGSSYPEYQLLAELVSAVELNKWNTIKGSYITGENWYFVILQKLKKHKYKYFVSKTFNSTKIEDLKSIYKNLIYIKNEIIYDIKNN